MNIMWNNGLQARLADHCKWLRFLLDDPYFLPYVITKLSLENNWTIQLHICGSACGVTVIIVKMGGARGVVVIAVGNEHGDTSSNPGRYWLHFT